MKKVDTNMVVAVAALVTSVVAVFIAWDESRLMRKSQAASFMPILETRPSFNLSSDQLSLEITIRNSGAGVAYVQSAELLFDDEPVRSYDRFFETVLRQDLKDTADFSWASMKGFLQPGESKSVIALRWPDRPETRAKLSAFFGEDIAAKTDRVRLKLCYCSVFEECWQQTELGSALPDRQRECTPSDDPSELLWQTRFADAGE
ncbi:MAG: hypothetical protein V2I43_04270 [Parvularcula sp.]|jgi:hypothetical protein|nr:hypothetical protein [Parvularcula sp.]